MIKKVSFKSDSQTISGRLITPDKIEGKLPGVIFYHGTPSDQQGFIPRAEYVSKKGIVAMTMDYSGFGESSGSYSEQSLNDILRDASSGLEFLGNQELVDKERLGICGRSTGGYVASIVGSRHQVKSLIVAVPSIFPDKYMDLGFEKLDKRETERDLFNEGESIEDTECIRAVKEYRGDLLIVQHEFDQYIPESWIKAYLNNAVSAKSVELKLVRGVVHRIPDEQVEKEQEWREMVADWFLETL